MRRTFNISELHEDVRELAEYNREHFPHYGRQPNLDEDNINSAFLWNDTPEGQVYWEMIYYGESQYDVEVAEDEYEEDEYQEDDQIIF